MKRILLLLTVLLAQLSFAQVPTYNSAIFYPPASTSKLEDMVTDSEGDLISAGWFFGTLDIMVDTFSAGTSMHGFVLKTDSVGNPEWATELKGNYVRVMALELTADDGMIVSGQFLTKLVVGSDSVVSSVRSGFILKLRNDGSLEWMTHLDGLSSESGGLENYEISDISSDNAGNIYFTGFFRVELSCQGQTITSVGENDMVYGKMDASGSLIWMKRAGGNFSGSCGLENNDAGESVCMSPDGNIFMTGHFAYNFTIGGMSPPSASNYGLFAAKIDPSGNAIWVKSVNGAVGLDPDCMTADASGNLIVVGHWSTDCYINGDTLHSWSVTSSPFDFVILKYDPTGNILWYRQEGFTSGNDYPGRVMTDDAGNIYTTGYHTATTQIGDSLLVTTGSIYGDRIYLSCYDKYGSPRFVTQCGGYQNTTKGLLLNRDHDIVFAGFSIVGSGTDIAFGPFTSSVVGNHLFIAVIGNPVSTVGTDQALPSLDFQMFPVPAQNRLQFESAEKINLVEIRDVQGRIVFAQRDFSGIHGIELDLPAGMYMVECRSGNNLGVGRLVVTK